VQGQLGEPLLGGAPGGDVLDLREQDASAVMFVHPGQSHQTPQGSTVAVAKSHLGAQLAVTGIEQSEDASAVRLVLEAEYQRLSEEPLWFVAQQTGQRVVDPDDVAVAVHQELAVE